MQTTLVEEIAERREAAGLTQAELATEAGVARGTIWNWESGRCHPRPGAALGSVAAVLGIPARLTR